jgi:predicted nucleic acid-binding protein
VSGIVADTSVWIDFFAGVPTPSLEDALAQGLVVLPPVVVAELVSGATRPRERAAIADLLQELPLHETPRSHWVRVGELRRHLRARGVSSSTTDVHVAQCAIDRDAILLARDAIFDRITRHTALRLGRS